MLRHYLRFALRGLARQKLHSCLAIAVLTLGLTCFIGAAVILLHVDSYDARFGGADRLVAIYQSLVFPPGARSSMVQGTDEDLKQQLELMAPELAGVARLALQGMPAGGTAAVDGGQPQAHSIGFADP